MSHASIFIIIQARMTSSRLPGKVLLPLCGKTVLEVMIERLSPFRDNIIIATTNDGSEKPIMDLCNRAGVRYYRGDTQNVLSRYYGAACKFGAEPDDIIVRCTSDCPIIDHRVTSEAIHYFKEQNFEYVVAGQEGGFPRGFDTEVFTFAQLAAAAQNATTDYQKEHVTPYIKELATLGQLAADHDGSKYRLTLDEPDDYEAIQEVYKQFDNQLDFNYDELFAMLEANPYIYDINKSVEQTKAQLR
jgi:spore coat polysaccharide biosynthesis protein SpsF